MNFYTNVMIRGNDILYRGVENGRRIKKKIPYQPTLYVPTNDVTEWKSLDGRYLDEFRVGGIIETNAFVKEHRNTVGLELHGNSDYVYSYIADEFPVEMDYKFDDLVIAYIDIETECEKGFPDYKNPNERVIAITLAVGDEYHVLGLGDFKTKNPDEIAYNFRTETELLEEFYRLWNEIAPDIVTGWNIRFFDIPYLYMRTKVVLGEKKSKMLSPWRYVRDKVVTRMNRDHDIFEPIGISVLDYYELYQTFTYTNQESYRLDHIAFVELGENKLSYDEFDSIAEFYKKDFQKFIEYNIKDVRLVHKLEQKMKLLELVVALTYSAKVNMMDVYSQVKTWDQIIFHYLYEKKIIVPPKNFSEKDTQYAGAYVKDPIVGKHDWIVSFDLNSLYPHLIMQYNISPDTKVKGTFSRRVISVDSILNERQNDLLDEWKEQDYCIAANGTLYRRDKQGFLPELMQKLYEERKKYKKLMIEAQKQREEVSKMNMPTIGKAGLAQKLDNDIAKYHNFQLVRKIQLNSAYGAIGNEWFRYYDVEMAEAITLSGQLSIRWIENKLNAFLNETLETEDYDYVVASDTDSVYIRLGNLVQKTCTGKSTEQIVDYLDRACEKIIEPFIEKQYEELSRMMNAYSNEMYMKREVISSTGVWTAKKRYMLNVHDSEGVRYSEPKLKIMGIETSRSSTPHVVRQRLKDMIKIIMNGTENDLIESVSEFRNEFYSLSPEEVAFPRGVSNMNKYKDNAMIYTKGTPIAVKGALIYNHYINEMKLTRKYRKIIEGDKIKFIYLKTPNPFAGAFGKDHVLSFPNGIPKEFGLTDYINYDKQFQTSFLDPLTTILNAVGWEYEKKASLESFFG
jgi:DNA polymerase elongation subunit (family B)